MVVKWRLEHRGDQLQLVGRDVLQGRLHAVVVAGVGAEAAVDAAVQVGGLGLLQLAAEDLQAALEVALREGVEPGFEFVEFRHGRSLRAAETSPPAEEGAEVVPGA